MNKRALVVDDSRSARVILSRMLEAHGVQVDTAESGEQALEYVRTATPDVIFMDQLMPGMDGLQALRMLKSDARTQTIPVMMYTSQDDADYARRARAYGAIGVLSKMLTPADVSRALYQQLQLVPDRRESSRSINESSGAAFADVGSANREVTPSTATLDRSTTEMRTALASDWQEREADLRRTLHAEFEVLAQRLIASQRAAIPANSPPSLASSPASAALQWPRRGSVQVLAISLVAALLGFAVYAYVQQRGQAQLVQANAQLTRTASEQQRQIETLRGELLQRAATTQTIEVLPVPYGEPPFAGARIDQIRDRIMALQAVGFAGTVQIDNFVGDFCLSGSAVTGFKPAPADFPLRRCDAIGNLFEDGLAEQQRQSREFIEMLAMLTRNGALGPEIKFVFGGRKPAIAYPPKLERITAGEWNQVATRNNRVEISLRPADVQ